MKVPLSLLKEYIPLHHAPEKIASALTLAGIEVEGIETIGSSFSGVVAAKVLETVAHPNADRLKVATVFDGKEQLQIVCGAKNCRPGIVVPLAKIGATLAPDASGKPLKIKKGKLRDVESFGMLCGADELGLEKASEGIMELSHEIALGSDLSELFHDVIFDVSLTPNLGHCLGVYGLARELAAIFNLTITPLHFDIKETLAPIDDQLVVNLKASHLCQRFMARALDHVEVGPSPDWLVQKLMACGACSVNNVVDIATYVMLITGQPIHIYDADKIAGSTLHIIEQSHSQAIETQEATVREIPVGSVVICSEQGPVAIGGIIGSLDSCPTASTKKVIIEAALYSAQAIRKSGKELGLKTDASYRFERGCDPLGLCKALDMAAYLMQKICNAAVHEGIIDRNPHPFIAKKIFCRMDRVQAVLGLQISQREVVDIFERLSMHVAQEKENILAVIIPSFRNDISSEIDLIEEIARLWGYNRMPKCPPLHVSSSMEDAPIFSFENKVRTFLCASGLQEMITCDLISPHLAELTQEPTYKDVHSMRVMQPKSCDFSVLRPSLLAGLLQSISRNISHQNKDISCFEIGRVHFRQSEKIEEICCVGIAMTGASRHYHHSPKPAEVDFFDIKGVVENLLTSLNMSDVHFEVSHLHNLQPGRQCRIVHNGISLGVIGELHPAKAKAFDIEQRVYFAQLNLHELLELSPKSLKVTSLPVYPGSTRDLTLSVAKNTTVEQIFTIVKKINEPLLKNFHLLDVFFSETMGLDKKNITLRFCYRDDEKTLSNEMVEGAHRALVEVVLSEAKPMLRS